MKKKQKPFDPDIVIGEATKTIEKNSMIKPGDTVVIAVSGGPDSMCLLDVLTKLSVKMDFKIIVCHVNHSLRGEKSDEEHEFVKEYCRENGISFRWEKVDVKSFSSKNKIGIEEAARILRYDVLRKIAKSCGGVIAVAHHRQDRAETVLMNLLRGCSTRGLAGMLAVNGDIIRPLIECPKEHIDLYIKNLSIPYRTDETNLMPVNTRNKIRLELLPVMERIGRGDIIGGICRTGDLCGDDDEYMESVARGILEQGGGKTFIPCKILNQTHPALGGRIIRNMYENARKSKQNLVFEQTRQLLELSEKCVGNKTLDLCDGYCGIIRKERLYIMTKKERDGIFSDQRKKREETAKFEIPLQLGKVHETPTGQRIWAKLVVNEEDLVYNATKWCFPEEEIKGAKFRFRREGDRIHPNRNSGGKSVKKYLNEKNIPADTRDSLVFLAKGNEVLWICNVGGNKIERSEEDSRMVCVECLERENTQTINN